MNKNPGIIIGIIAVVIILGAVFASMNNKKDAMATEEKMEQKTMEDKIIPEDEVTEEKEMMIGDSAEKTDNMIKKDEASMMKGSYEAYSPEKLARAETGDVVLFFHASWCPSCRGLNSDIEANMNMIPEGVSILKTDYDKETELKKKYGITYQHTLVQVDKNGNMIKKWSGSPTLNNLLSQIQ